MAPRSWRIALLAFAAPWLLASCRTRLVLPAPPADPRPVVLLDHGRHSSLILTDARGVPWRYAYGNWRWYVEQDTSLGAGARALFTRSKAALGRSRLQPRDPLQGWQPQVGSTIDFEVRFDASGTRVDALLRELDRTFATSPTPPAYHRHLQLEVVPYPVPYTLAHNSNHQVARWLRAVGVEVRGSPTFGNWPPPAR